MSMDEERAVVESRPATFTVLLDMMDFSLGHITSAPQTAHFLFSR
jgi:hypothetical protein